MRARPLSAAFVLACVLIAGCGAEPIEPAPERSAPLRAPSCELGELTVRPGSSVALAPRAIALRDAGALKLLPLGSEATDATPLEVLRIPSRGLQRRGAGWLALAATPEGPALLAIRSASSDGAGLGSRIVLGPGSLTDGALVVWGDRAIATWLDEARTMRVARIDLLRDLATAPVVLEDSVGGALVAAATQGGAVVGFAAPDAPLFDIRETTATRRSAPGLVRGLATTSRGTAVLHEAPDRTGLWLTIGDAASIRVTQPDVRAASPSLAALESGMLLVYREGRDVFLQPLSAQGEPTAQPQVAGAAGESASAPLVAVDDDQFWIAWEATSEAGPTVHVRTGRCDSR